MTRSSTRCSSDVQWTFPCLCMPPVNNRRKMASCNRNLLFISGIATLFTFLIGVFYTSLDHKLHESGLVSNLLEVKDYFVENADQKSRLSEYCNIDVPRREAVSSYDIPGWELQHLAINIRHGDRSALHRIPGTTTPPVTLTDKNSSYIDIRAREYTHHFKCLHLKKLVLPNSTDAVYSGVKKT